MSRRVDRAVLATVLFEGRESMVLYTYPGQSMDEATLALAPVLNGSDTGDLRTPFDRGVQYATSYANWWAIKNPIAGQTIAALPDISILNFPDGTGIVQDTLAFGSMTLYQAYTTTANKQTTVAYAAIATSTPQSDPILTAQHPGYVMNDDWEKLVIPKANSGPGWLTEFYLSVTGGSGYLDSVYGPEGVTIPDQGRFLVTTGTITGARDAAWGDWQDVIDVDGGTTDTGSTSPFPADPADQVDFALSGVDPSLIPQATIVPSDTGHPQRDALAGWWNDGGEFDIASGSPFSLIDTFAVGRAKLSALYGTVQDLAAGDLPDFVFNNQTDDPVRNLTTNFERDVQKPLATIIKDAIRNDISVKSFQTNLKDMKTVMFTYLNGLLDEMQTGFDQLHPQAATLAAQIGAGGGASTDMGVRVEDRQSPSLAIIAAGHDLGGSR